MPNNKLQKMFNHSDNASQHFKSTGNLEFFSRLVEDQGEPGKCAFVYSFGAPGHGKGPWDGVGGGWKMKVANLIKSYDELDTGVPGVDGGLVRTAKDVYDALIFHYTNYWRPKASNSNSRPISHVHFFISSKEHDMDPVQRPNQPETFTHLEKITSNYQFVASKKGVVHSRHRPCWCLPCFTAVKIVTRYYLGH